MTLYSYSEIKDIIQNRTFLSPSEETSFLEEFKNIQPDIYSAIFGTFYKEISKINKDMGNLFIDLCFDIIWFYDSAFGKPPKIDSEKSNFYLSEIDAELKSMPNNISMDQNFRYISNNRILKNVRDDGLQTELLRYINNAVEDYVSFNDNRNDAQACTNNILFVINQYMAKLQSKTA